MGYKQPSSGLPFKEIGSSPVKQKGDNLKRIMSEKKALAKKTGTFYAPGAGPKVKVPNVKDFNVEGSSGAGKKILTKQEKRAKTKMLKQIVKKGAKKGISRLIPGVGGALLAYDVLKRGIKNVKEGKTKIPKGYYEKGGKGYQKRDYSKKFNFGNK